ncbi:MAG: hypothetical protein GF418_11695 [Chitinivibrionales bacterium]|nr:hypothetical protein [Chitinivibrionales bacterium]MBD3396279.1 hypothetical protein [Chitinivibrionales bacterium]
MRTSIVVVAFSVAGLIAQDEPYFFDVSDCHTKWLSASYGELTANRSYDTLVVDSSMMCSLRTCIWVYDTIVDTLIKVTGTAAANVRCDAESCIKYSLFDPLNSMCAVYLDSLKAEDGTLCVIDSMWGDTLTTPGADKRLEFKWHRAESHSDGLTAYLHGLRLQDTLRFSCTGLVSGLPDTLETRNVDSLINCIKGTWRWLTGFSRSGVGGGTSWYDPGDCGHSAYIEFTSDSFFTFTDSALVKQDSIVVNGGSFGYSLLIDLGRFACWPCISEQNWYESSHCKVQSFGEILSLSGCMKKAYYVRDSSAENPGSRINPDRAPMPWMRIRNKPAISLRRRGNLVEMVVPAGHGLLADVAVYDSRGRKISALSRPSVVHGHQILVWNAGGLAHGIYAVLLNLDGGTREAIKTVLP